MWPFKKKKEIQPPPAAPVCDHKYREFDRYKDCTFYPAKRRMVFKILKPYVCIHCGHRKDILLLEVLRDETTWEETLDYSDRQEKDFSLVSRVDVEEQIADFQLIDREYLKIAHGLFPERGILKEEST